MEIEEDVIKSLQQGNFTVTAIKAQAQEGCATLIPYYAWNHRGAGEMDVWLK